MPKVTTALIGCGQRGPGGHGRVAKASEKLELVAVCDIDESRAQAAAVVIELRDCNPPPVLHASSGFCRLSRIASIPYIPSMYRTIHHLRIRGETDGQEPAVQAGKLSHSRWSCIPQHHKDWRWASDSSHNTGTSCVLLP